MPLIPGLLFFALGLALYLFLLRNEKSKVVPPFHRQLIKFRNYFINLKIMKKPMGLIKKIQKKKNEKIKEEILKHGLILFGFNFALTLALFFALTAVTIMPILTGFNVITVTFMPLLVIFIFAGACAILWYRFGQIINLKLKEKKILFTGIIVLISVIPLLFILLFLSMMISFFSFVASSLTLIFIGTVFITVLAVVFEMVAVSLGVITGQK